MSGGKEVQKSIRPFFTGREDESASKKQKITEDSSVNQEPSESSTSDSVRNFQRKWLTTHSSWLSYDEDKEKIDPLLSKTGISGMAHFI